MWGGQNDPDPGALVLLGVAEITLVQMHWVLLGVVGWSGLSLASFSWLTWTAS